MSTYRGFEIKPDQAGYGLVATQPNFDAGMPSLHGWTQTDVREEIDLWHEGETSPAIIVTEAERVNLFDAVMIAREIGRGVMTTDHLMLKALADIQSMSDRRIAEDRRLRNDPIVLQLAAIITACGNPRMMDPAWDRKSRAGLLQAARIGVLKGDLSIRRDAMQRCPYRRRMEKAWAKIARDGAALDASLQRQVA